jgi:hypothetical protein
MFCLTYKNLCRILNHHHKISSRWEILRRNQSDRDYSENGKVKPRFRRRGDCRGQVLVSELSFTMGAGRRFKAKSPSATKIYRGEPVSPYS